MKRLDQVIICRYCHNVCEKWIPCFSPGAFEKLREDQQHRLGCEMGRTMLGFPRFKHETVAINDLGEFAQNDIQCTECWEKEWGNILGGDKTIREYREEKDHE